MGKALTKEDFIRDSLKIHKNKYNYSLVNYINSSTKVDIICQKHGVFSQEPRMHKSGQGCDKCARDVQTQKKTFPVEAVLKSFKEKHGVGRYGYDFSTYKSSKSKIKVFCSVCGAVFSQQVKTHLRGSGCVICARKLDGLSKRLSTDEFISKAKIVHGNDKYEYAETKYSSSQEKVTVVCKEHGEFLIRANQHLHGKGCGLCGRAKAAENSKYTQEEFLKKCNTVHNNKFNYSKTIYTGVQDNVIVICPKCGEFKTNAGTHMHGHISCRCHGRGFLKDQPASLYLLKTDNIFKVGITCRAVIERVKEVNKSSKMKFKTVKVFAFTCGKECFNLESRILKSFRNSFEPIDDTFDGSTECFYYGRFPHEGIEVVEQILDIVYSKVLVGKL